MGNRVHRHGSRGVESAGRARPRFVVGGRVSQAEGRGGGSELPDRSGRRSADHDSRSTRVVVPGGNGENRSGAEKSRHRENVEGSSRHTGHSETWGTKTVCGWPWTKRGRRLSQPAPSDSFARELETWR